MVRRLVKARDLDLSEWICSIKGESFGPRYSDGQFRKYAEAISELCFDNRHFHNAPRWDRIVRDFSHNAEASLREIFEAFGANPCDSRAALACGTALRSLCEIGPLYEVDTSVVVYGFGINSAVFEGILPSRFANNLLGDSPGFLTRVNSICQFDDIDGNWDRIRKRHNLTIARETLVAFLLTNRLRARVPNFMYVFGHFDHHSSMLDVDECEEEMPQRLFGGGVDARYLMIEKVRGVNMREWYYTKTFCKEVEDGIFTIFAQVLLALALLRDDLRGGNTAFAHGDIHPGNIIVEELEEECALEYKIGKTAYTLRTRVIARLVDFECAQLRVPVPSEFARKYAKSEYVKDGFLYMGSFFEKCHQTTAGTINSLYDVTRLATLLNITIERGNLASALVAPLFGERKAPPDQNSYEKWIADFFSWVPLDIDCDPLDYLEEVIESAPEYRHFLKKEKCGFENLPTLEAYYASRTKPLSEAAEELLTRILGDQGEE